MNQRPARSTRFSDEPGADTSAPSGQSSAAGSVIELVGSLAGDHGSRTTADLIAENALLRFALESMPVGFSLFGADDTLQLWNEKLFEIWSYPESMRVRGTDFTALMASVEHREIDHPDSPRQPLRTPGRRRREFMRGDGGHVEVHVQLLEDGSTVAVHEDVTVKRANEARIRYLANHDCLTGLPNRGSLNRELERLLLEGTPSGTAVLYLDLDRFKPVNDTLGHAAGDLLLVATARRLEHCTRSGDLVARIGGDEFVVVQHDIAQPAGAISLGRRIIDELSRPFDLDGQPAQIGASVGVAIPEAGDADSDALLKHADRALYQAKSRGRGTLVVFDRTAPVRST